MAEKKSIVIKLKYPTGRVSNQATFKPKAITEWNVKRIVFAVTGLGVVAVLLGYFIFSSLPKGNVDKVAVSPAATTVGAPAVKIEVVKQDDAAGDALKKKIIRAQLTPKIVDSEPVGEVDLPLKAGEKNAVSIYYFAELADMKGQTVYHEWLLDDKLISKKTVNISDKTWRTSSRQMIAYTTNSNWVVRLVDDTGKVLNEKKFTVVLDK